MIKNEIIETTCNSETGWEEFLRGKAVFQVTLVPDKDDDVVNFLEDLYFSRMMANGTVGQDSSAIPVAESLAGDSRFADAES